MRRRVLSLGLVLWIAGTAGAAALTLATLPMLRVMAPFPTPLAVAAALLQSGLLITAAVWVGAVLGQRIGLRAPAIAAWLDRQPSAPAWRAQLGAALAVGGFSAVFIVLAQCVAPAPLLPGGSGGRLALICIPPLGH